MFDALDFAELEELMRDTVTVEVVADTVTNPLTGAGESVVVRTIVENWPSADQDDSLRSQQRFIVNGVNGSIPVSRLYVKWFEWPELAPGESVVIRVNGRERQSLRQGKPVDVGGMKQLWLMELSAPTGGEA